MFALVSLLRVHPEAFYVASAIRSVFILPQPLSNTFQRYAFSNNH
jgi:hypothetical protein